MGRCRWSRPRPRIHPLDGTAARARRNGKPLYTPALLKEDYFLTRTSPEPRRMPPGVASGASRVSFSHHVDDETGRTSAPENADCWRAVLRRPADSARTNRDFQLCRRHDAIPDGAGHQDLRFPQVGGPCNLHNWLATQLQQAGIENHLLDNAFVQVGDWEKAQNIADGFEVAKLHAKLEQWVKQFCPVLQQFGREPQLDAGHGRSMSTDVVFHRQGLVKKTAHSYKYYLTSARPRGGSVRLTPQAIRDSGGVSQRSGRLIFLPGLSKTQQPRYLPDYDSVRNHRVERRRAQFRSISFRCVRPFRLRGKEPPDHADVSFSPSKIPYDGFSPVRLQTGLLRHDLRSPHTGCNLIRGQSPFTAPLWPFRASFRGH